MASWFTIVVCQLSRCSFVLDRIDCSIPYYCCPIKKIEDRDKAVENYLTEEELQALYEMPLSGKKEHIRDVFLIGCYTCQRVSDYNNLNADNFKTSRKERA